MPTEAAARPQARFPLALALAAGAAIGARLLGPSVHDRVAWVPLAQAQAAAGSQGRPLFYNFTAEWCGPCKRLEREVFSDVRWAGGLGARFVPVRVVDREREDGANSPEVDALQKRFAVDSFPTLVVARADGTVLSRHVGYGNPRAVRDFLILAETAAAPPRAARPGAAR